MKLARAAKILKVQERDLFPIPSINSIVRVGKIPKAKSEVGFWVPIWKISVKYNDKQAMTILTMLKKRLHDFAIAFENEDNYLVLSDDPLDSGYADKILSEITEESKLGFSNR
jgi:hypothetical protein